MLDEYEKLVEGMYGSIFRYRSKKYWSTGVLTTTTKSLSHNTLPLKSKKTKQQNKTTIERKKIIIK